MHETPKELIQNRLDEYERAMEKSNKSHEEGKIPDSTHDTHIENLTPKLEEFRYALQILNKYT